MENRMREAQEKGLLVVALILFVAFLSEVLFKPIGWLIIPIFILGSYHVIYQVFIRKN